MGEGTRPCPFPVTGNGHGRVTEPKGEHFSGRNLGKIPNFAVVSVVLYAQIARTKADLITRDKDTLYRRCARSEPLHVL